MKALLQFLVLTYPVTWAFFAAIGAAYFLVRMRHATSREIAGPLATVTR
jgi:hypothetical protein